MGNMFQSVLDRLKSRARCSGMSDANLPGKLSVRSVWRRNHWPADIVAFAALHVPHVGVPISAFGRCTEHPSQMAKRPYAEIDPSKPCVVWVYPACRKTRWSFRLPAGIPYGSARSGEIRGRFGDRGVPNGGRRQPSIDMPHSRIRYQVGSAFCSLVWTATPM